MAYGNYAPFYRGGFFNPMQQPQMPMMAENQGQFAQPYQAPIQTNPAPMQMQTQPTNDVLLFVLNENEASAYPVAPNNSVVLWDKSNPTIYIKSVNAQGVPSMRVLDFKERVDAPSQEQPQAHVCKCGDKFVSKADFEELKAKFEELMAKYEALETKGTERSKTKSSKPKESEE